LKIFLFIILLLINLQANESDLDLKFFGTLGAVYNDNKDYIYRTDPFEKDGSSNDLNYFSDSILGLQTTYKFSDELSLIAQGILKQDYYTEKKASIDWGYLKYDSNENFIFKIGKIRAPYYRNSNNQNIGYSKLMIREPIEVYGQFPFSSYGGIEFIYSNIINKYFYTIQANYGQTGFDSPMHSVNEVLDNEIKEIKGLNFTFGNDIIEARATYMQGLSTSDNKSIDAMFSTLSPDLVDKYALKDKKSQYFGFGLFIDYRDFIFSSEYGKRKINAFYANLHGYYTTLGYRIFSLTPYISYAKVKMDDETSINSGSIYLDELVKIQNVSQSSNTIGFKYHINQNLDFKFEYQRVKPTGEYGSFYLSESYPNSTLNVYSFVIDFIF